MTFEYSCDSLRASISPTVSVILPTRDRAHTLGRAIRSVLAQEFTDYELIVIDDGSVDETPSVIGGFGSEPRIRAVRTPGRGAGCARNLGARMALGRYLAFQDSDDEWMPGKLSQAVAALEAAGTDTAVFYGDMVRVTTDGRRTPYPAPRNIVPGRLIDDARGDYQVMDIGIQSAVIRRESFEAAGGFDERLRRYIDMDLLVRLALRDRFIHAGGPVVSYYEGPGISSDGAALVDARRYLIRKYGGQLRENPVHLARQYHRLATALKRDGQRPAWLLCKLRACIIAWLGRSS